MAKTWEQMTSDEKIEDLRRDVKKIIAAVNNLTTNQDAISAKVGDLFNQVLSVKKRLDDAGH
jgi:hypothetical protein